MAGVGCQVVGLCDALVQVNNRGSELSLPYVPPSTSSYRTFPLRAFCIIALKPTSEPTGRVKYSAARKRLRCFSAVCSRHCWRVPRIQSRVDRWWQKRRSRPNWLSRWDYKRARDGLHRRHYCHYLNLQTLVCESLRSWKCLCFSCFHLCQRCETLARGAKFGPWGHFIWPTSVLQHNTHDTTSPRMCS